MVKSDLKRRVYVGVGSNVADSERKVQEAIGFLCALLGDAECSHIYETPCMGNAACAPYTNAVVSGESLYDCDALNRIFKSYEQLQGRVRGKGKEVVIDLDLVVCDREVLRKRDFEALHFRIGLKDMESWQK